MLLTTLILLIKQENGLQINVNHESFSDAMSTRFSRFVNKPAHAKMFSFTSISFDVSNKAFSMKIAESGRRRRPRGYRKQNVSQPHDDCDQHSGKVYPSHARRLRCVVSSRHCANAKQKKPFFCHSIRFCFQSISLASERKLSKNLPRLPTEAFQAHSKGLIIEVTE